MSKTMARVLWVMLLLVIAGSRSSAQERSTPAGVAAAPAGTIAPAGSAEAPQAAAAEAPPALMDNPLGEVPPDEPRMEAYSHGHYVLYFLGAFWDMAVLALLVFTGFGATLQAWAERVTRRPNLKVAVYTVLFTAVTVAASFPLTVYGGFVREKKFGFATQTFPAWLGDQGKALLVATILQMVFFVLFYLAIRRLGRRWWIAGWALSVLFTIFVQAIAPVFIAPLFNTFKPL